LHIVTLKAHKYIVNNYTTYFKVLIVLNTFGLFIHCNVDKKLNTNIFSYNESTSINTLDPHFVKSQSENWVVTQLNAGLVQLDTLLQPKSMIADSWQVSNDGLTYTFFLNKGVYFHAWENHGPRSVSAFDVLYSFNRLMNPSTASPGTWVFSDKIDSVTPFRAIDSFTFSLRLKQAFPPLIGILSMPYCYVIPKEAVEFYGKDFRSHPVGCGPFYFKRWEENVGLVLRRNVNYFEKDEHLKSLPYLEAIHIDVNPNKASAFMDFAAGKYDFFNEIESGVKDEILTPTGELTEKYKNLYNLQKAPFLNTEFLMFNMEQSSALIKNPKIRLAINYAIDKASIVTNARNGLGTAANHGFTPPSLLKKTTEGIAYNKTKALELIKQSGENIGAPITLSITADYMDMALLIKNNLEQIGFNIKIEVHPSGYLRQLRNEQQIDFYRGSWIADYPDAENYLACFYSKNLYPNGPNYSRYKNPQFDKLYEKSMQTTNSLIRQNLLHQMDSILLINPPFALLYYDKSLRISNKNVQQLFSYPNNSLQLKYVFKQ